MANNVTLQLSPAQLEFLFQIVQRAPITGEVAEEVAVLKAMMKAAAQEAAKAEE